VILTAAVRSGLSTVRKSVRLAGGAVSHALWWFDHHAGHGEARKAPDDPRRRGERGG
jgi:hypothetical protein